MHHPRKTLLDGWPDNNGLERAHGSENQETYVVRVPCNIAHASPSTHRHARSSEALHPSHSTRTATIRQSSNLALSSEIPDNRVSGAASCSERVLDMMVPSKGGDLVELGTTRSGGVRFAWVFEVPYVDLLGASMGEKRAAADMFTSPFTAPEENRFVCMGLKSSPRAGPV